MSADPWVWAAALCTLAVFSFLFRDNVLYRIAEHLLVGVAAGYMLVLTWHDVLWPEVFQPIGSQGPGLALVPLALSLLFLGRLVPGSLGHQGSRIAVAFLVAVSAGVNISTQLQARVLSQAAATMALPATGSWVDAFGQAVLVLGTLTGLSYFYFSREHRGVLGVSARIGALTLMLAFGAAFGYTVMSRIALLIGRVLFLLRDWLGVLSV